MGRVKKIIADTVFVVQILIAFILIFESRIYVPSLLQAFGRLHPVMLHLPIGLLLVTTLLIFARRFFEGASLNDLISFLLHFTALTASFTTIMGLLLSLEGTFSADQLQLHKWLGVVLSFLCWSLLLVESKINLLKPLSSVGVIVLVFTGHFGASLTHGEDYVFAPLRSDDLRVARVITDSTPVFSATIEPIFESKCYGCHNNKKAKGNLILTSLESMTKGGKNGDLWKPGDATHSLLVKRVSLPLEDEDHMPPKDKAQLTEDEIYFISQWIETGADTDLKLNELEEGDTLKQLASVIIPRYQHREDDKPLYAFNFASPEKIQKLSRPNRTVFQIAKNEPAIQAEFYLRQNYDRRHLKELVEVNEQLILLNLSNMPVEDTDLETITKFYNLEVLNLNNTQIKGDRLKELASLTRLRSVSLSGTGVSFAAVRELGNCKSLREVFVWNTGVTEADITSLTRDFPHIRWDVGYIPDENEILKLNVPLLENKSVVLDREEEVGFKHNLPGTIVRYSLDGTDPDSINSPVFNAPLPVRDYAKIKTKAFREGWLSSDVEEFIFFRKGFRPDTVVLLTRPDEKYQGEGGVTLIDEIKGIPSNLRESPAWLGFSENDLVANFIFEERRPTIRNITLSYVRNNGMICLPPEEMQVWGGNDADNLKLIKKVNPSQAIDSNTTRIEGISMDLPATNYKYYRLVGKPVKKMKSGNSTKRKIWLMVDEVFFN